MGELYDVRTPVVLRVEADSSEEALDIVMEALQTIVDRHAKQRRLSKTVMFVEGIFNIKGRGVVVVAKKPKELELVDRVVTIEGAGTWQVTSVDAQFSQVPGRVGLCVNRINGEGEIAVGASIKVCS